MEYSKTKEQQEAELVVNLSDECVALRYQRGVLLNAVKWVNSELHKSNLDSVQIKSLQQILDRAVSLVKFSNRR